MKEARWWYLDFFLNNGNNSSIRKHQSSERGRARTNDSQWKPKTKAKAPTKPNICGLAMASWEDTAVFGSDSPQKREIGDDWSFSHSKSCELAERQSPQLPFLSLPSTSPPPRPPRRSPRRTYTALVGSVVVGHHLFPWRSRCPACARCYYRV